VLFIFFLKRIFLLKKIKLWDNSSKSKLRHNFTKNHKKILPLAILFAFVKKFLYKFGTNTERRDNRCWDEINFACDNWCPLLGHYLWAPYSPSQKIKKYFWYVLKIFFLTVKCYFILCCREVYSFIFGNKLVLRMYKRNFTMKYFTLFFYIQGSTTNR